MLNQTGLHSLMFEFLSTLTQIHEGIFITVKNNCFQFQILSQALQVSIAK